MSKISDQLLHQQEIQLEYQIKFMDYLYDLMPKQPELGESEINDMERSQQRPLTAKNIILSEQSLNTNNVNQQKVA